MDPAVIAALVAGPAVGDRSAQLQAQVAALTAQKRTLAAEHAKEEKKRQRLMAKAEGLSTPDLLSIVAAREQAKAKAKAKGQAKAKGKAKAKAKAAADVAVGGVVGAAAAAAAEED